MSKSVQSYRSSNQRPSKAGRPTRAFHADLITHVLGDPGAGALESAPRPRISREHDALTWTEREHVRSHRVELVFRHLDELEAEIDQALAKWNGQQRRIDDGEVTIDRADKRHQMQHVARAAPV